MGLIQDQLFADEAARQAVFPTTRNGVFLGHAGVCPLPRAAAEAVQKEAHRAMVESQEPANFMGSIEEIRAVAARMIGASAHEIALTGSTAVGLNLVAAGLDWKAGDEVVYYAGDYPSNVYPWTGLAARGVKPVALEPEQPGWLTPELVLAAVTPQTKLVALASCHFLTGYMVDYKAIGAVLKEKGVLFCVDGIQSLGAAELDCRYFDFMSCGAHKWLLGPLGAGILYVKAEHFPILRPALLGAWNVNSPQFVAQAEIAFPDHARRYEWGAQNFLGGYGMKASMEMFLTLGIDKVRARLLQLHDHAAGLFREAGYTVLSDAFPDAAKGGIVTVYKGETNLAPLFDEMKRRKITASHRWDTAGKGYLRFSPHFYNSFGDLEAAAAVLAGK
jgi:selenocysteine lyase/cysteine desulfurase